MDYRRLNEVTRKDAYPLPRIDDCLDCLEKAKYFSVMDLQTGFYQISVKPAERHKTAFVTRSGLYEYRKMAMGLCNAPSTFQRCMELVMRGLQWQSLLVYLDDLILFNETFDRHIEQLEEVFTRLRNSGLKLKPSKCDFFKTEVTFLGYVVSENGVKPDMDKVKSIKEWPVPKCTTDIRSFLGLCSYYRRFIRDFPSRASPLNRLLRGRTSVYLGRKV